MRTYFYWKEGKNFTLQERKELCKAYDNVDIFCKDVSLEDKHVSQVNKDISWDGTWGDSVLM